MPPQRRRQPAGRPPESASAYAYSAPLTLKVGEMKGKEYMITAIILAGILGGALVAYHYEGMPFTWQLPTIIVGLGFIIADVWGVIYLNTGK